MTDYNATLNIRYDSSVITITEEFSGLRRLNENAGLSTINNASEVIGPDGVKYNMSEIRDYAEAAVDYINNFCPYLTPFTTKLIRCFTFEVDTMATDGIYIFMNPGFVLKLINKCNGSLLGVIFVIIHEIYHNLMCHRERELAQPDVFTPYNANVANIAEDYEINWIITQTVEDPREMSDYDPSDPDDEPPYELDANGKPTDMKRLPFKNIIDQIGAGLLDEKFAGWTAEKIYRYFIDHMDKIPATLPPKKVKISKTDNSAASGPGNGGNGPGPEEIEYDLNPDERDGYEAGWAQAIADLRAQGLIESFTISSDAYQGIFEAVKTGNADYDIGYNNGYAACMKTVQNMLNNPGSGTSGSMPKITGNMPNIEVPKPKTPNNNQKDSNDSSTGSDGQQNGQETGQNGQDDSENGKQGSGQGSNSMSKQDVQDIINKIDKLAKEHQAHQGQQGQQGNNGQDSQRGSQDSSTGTANADGEYAGNDKFGIGNHVLSQSEGAKIAEKAGLGMEDMMKNGHDMSSVFDNEGLVMKTLNKINNKLNINLSKRKQTSNNPGTGITDIIGVLQDIRTTTIDWRSELEDYFSGMIHMQNIGYNNNYIWDERYVDVYDYDEPDALNKVLIFLDTSGSMMSSEEDVAKCIHNIKQIVKDADVMSADLYLFADGIYYGAPLDVNEISDNYEKCNIKLPIKSGGTTYTDIFKIIQEKYLDKRVIPDSIIIMTDEDLYSSISNLPKDFACKDETLFLVVSDVNPRRLPFGSAIYVKPGDFSRVARKTKLNESTMELYKGVPKRSVHSVDEAFRMPVKRIAPVVPDDSGDSDAVSAEISDPEAQSVQDKKDNKMVRDIFRSAAQSDSEEWEAMLNKVRKTIECFPDKYSLFNREYKDFDILFDDEIGVIGNSSPKKSKYMIIISISKNGSIKIYGDVTLLGDKRLVQWNKLFGRIKKISNGFVELTDIIGDMNIIGCSIAELPEYMPQAIVGSFNLLCLPNLTSLKNLPAKYGNINIDNCPKLSEEEIDRAGVVLESTIPQALLKGNVIKPKGDALSAIIESRLRLAERFNKMDESTADNVVNEDFRSTTFAKLFNTKKGSQRNGNRALTFVSAKNREILDKVEATSGFPIMWSEITDDMITVTHPKDNAKSIATLERRDKNTTDDWGVRIACDEDGKIIFIITGDNRSKENKYRKPGEGFYIYDWTDNKGWLYVDDDLVHLMNSRIDDLRWARLGFSIYLNAYLKLGIKTDESTDFEREDSPLLDMVKVMRKVNSKDPDELPNEYRKIRDVWAAVKNAYEYVDLENPKVYTMICDYYKNELHADSAYMDALDHAVRNAAPAIQEFETFKLDYAKQNLMRLTDKVLLIPDKTPMGYHFQNLTFPDFELVLDKIDIIYDIDSKHNSYGSRVAGDDRAELGAINPYDKDILKYGEFDIEKNRKTDNLEMSKFGVLNNSRKRKLIQNVRCNAITGTNYSLKQLNDPALKKMEDEGKLFSPNTYEKTKEILGCISDMIKSIRVRYEKLNNVFQENYPSVEENDKYGKVKNHYKSVEKSANLCIEAGDNLIKQAKIADSMLMKISTIVDDKRTISTGYRDTISGQLAEAFERMKEETYREVANIYDITDSGRGISAAMNKVSTIDIKSYMQKDWDDIKNKLRRIDNDDKKTSYTMDINKRNIEDMRYNSTKELMRCLSILMTGYIFLVKDMTVLKGELKALDRS